MMIQKHNIWLRAFICLFLLLSVLGFPGAKVYANTFTVTTSNDSGPGSLRQAIADAITNPGSDVIEFNIPAGDPGYNARTPGVWTIFLTSYDLKMTTGDITIAGDTQATNQGNTNPLGMEIEIDGSSITGPVFDLAASNITLNYLSITGGDIGVRIVGSLASNNTIQNCAIGLNGALNTAFPNDVGISIVGSAAHNNVMGNIVVGNTDDGIFIEDSDDTHLYSNYIGYYPGAPLINNGGDGVEIGGVSTGNIIGGASDYSNEISNNGENGIFIHRTISTEISHNMIGTTWDGMTAKGNGYKGIRITEDASGVSIQDNLVSGNSEDGIYFEGPITDSSIDNNHVGSNMDITGKIPNTWHGIGIYGSLSNPLERPTNITVSNNVIVGNGWSGLVLIYTSGNTATNNFIGTDPTGTQTTLGNVFYGIHIQGDDNTISGGLIAYNGLTTNSPGVKVDGGGGVSSIRNRITQVPIFANGYYLGIDNVAGGNNDYAPPLADPGYTCTHIHGYAYQASSEVEIFTDGYYEGSVPTDNYAYFDWVGHLHGNRISLTWTDKYGSTSEMTSLNEYFGCNYLMLPLIKK